MGIVQTFQGYLANATPANPIVITLTQPVAVGDQIMVAVGSTQYALNPQSVTDQLGNVGTQFSGQVGGGDSHFFSVWTMPITAAGTPVITIAPNAFFGSSALGAVGISLTGVGSPEFSSPVHNGGNSLTWSSVPITPAQADEILVTFDWAYGPPASITDSFILDQSLLVDAGGSQTELDLAHMLVSSLGTYTSSWVQGGGNGQQWRQVIVAFPITALPPVIATLSETSGFIGDTVTITGSNFGATQGSSTVTFNGVPVIPSFWSNTSLIITVPIGTTTGNVVVTTVGGSSNGVLFTVVAPPLGGFALIASYTSTGDATLPPLAVLTSLPASPVAPDVPVTLVWNTFNVAKVRLLILSSGGSPPFDTGIIINGVGGGTFAFPGGFSSTQIFALYTYDQNNNPLPLTSVYFLVVT